MIDHKIYNIWRSGGLAYELYPGQWRATVEDPLANGIFRDGNVLYYYCNGLLHREDGPAEESLLSVYQNWWYKGTKINCSSQEEFLKIIKLLAFT